MSEEVKLILDRGQATNDALRVYGDHLAGLREVIDYGTSLIPPAIETAEKNLVGLVVVGCMYKNVLAMLDGVEIHLSAGASLAAKVSLRAAFESHLGLAFALAKDTELRVRHYYAELRRRRLWTEVAIPDTAANKKLREVLVGEGFSTDVVDILGGQNNGSVEARIKEVNEINSLLQNEKYRKIDQAFDRFHRERRHDPPWHKPCGGNSIKEIARQVGYLSDYEVIYTQLSTVTHGSDFRSHVAYSGGLAELEPIRWLVDFRMVLFLSYTYAFRTMRLLIARYVPAEETTFREKYMSRWRELFRRIPSVNYTSGS